MALGGLWPATSWAGPPPDDAAEAKAEAEPASEGEPAPESGLRLKWTGPEACPTQAEVEQTLQRYLGGGSLDLKRGVTAEASVTLREDGNFRLVLVVETGGGTSVAQIDADRCELLAKAVALKVAVAVDPLAMIEAVERKPEPKPEPPPEPPPTDEEQAPVVEPEPKPPPPPPEPQVRGAVRVDGAVGFGILPDFGGGVGLTLAAVFPRWRLEAGGAFWPTRRARFPGLPDTGADILMGTASIRGCPMPKVKMIEFPLCVGIEFGGMQGHGIGVEQSVVATRLWAAALVDAGLAWSFTEYLSLWARAQLAVALHQPDFDIENGGQIHKAARAAPRGLVGLEVRFP
jgi:hypothetical protein